MATVMADMAMVMVMARKVTEDMARKATEDMATGMAVMARNTTEVMVTDMADMADTAAAALPSGGKPSTAAALPAFLKAIACCNILPSDHIHTFLYLF